MYALMGRYILEIYLLAHNEKQYTKRQANKSSRPTGKVENKTQGH
jgi:hypothetical protein